MSGGMYVALSGMRARAAQLDRVAADIANVGTSRLQGRAHQLDARRAPVLPGRARLGSGRRERSRQRGLRTRHAGRDRPRPGLRDRRPGLLRAADAGRHRATRGTGLHDRSASGELAAADGSLVLGQNGARIPIGDGRGRHRRRRLAPGRTDSRRTIAHRGLRRQQRADARTGRALRRPAPSPRRATRPAPCARARSKGRTCRRSIGSRSSTQLSRNFEVLNRGISVLLNDLDSRAISEFGRK